MFNPVKISFLLRFVLATVIALYSEVSIAQQKITVNKVIDAYERTANEGLPARLEYAQRQFSQKYDVDGNPIPEALAFESTITVFHDEDRWVKKGQTTNFSTRNGETLDVKVAHEEILDATWVSISQSGSRISIVGRLSYDEGKKIFGSHMAAATLFYGMFNRTADELFASVLRKAPNLELSADPVVIEGASTLCVTASFDHEKFVVYFDPDFGYLPRRIEHELDGTVPVPYLKDDTRVAIQRSRAKKVPKSIHVNYSNVKLEKRENRFVITGFDLSGSTRFEDFEQLLGRSEYRLTAIDFDKSKLTDDVFLSSLDIVEGARVLIYDDVANAYEWRDGRVRKKGLRLP